MISNAQSFLRRVSMVALVCLVYCSIKVSSFPTDKTGNDLLVAPSSQQLLSSQKRPREGEETTTKKDDGLSTMDYVWIGLGCLAALIIISCIISYLFCECVKNIICLPCTLICCCCGD